MHTARVMTAHYLPAVMVHILVDNSKFFIHRLHWTLPLILTLLSMLDRGIQSATETLTSLQKRGRRWCTHF